MIHIQYDHRRNSLVSYLNSTLLFPEKEAKSVARNTTNNLEHVRMALLVRFTDRD
jgi:hypothetical protein